MPAFRKTSHFSMAVDAADIDRDGLDDLFVVDMASRLHRLRMTQSGVLDPPPRLPGVHLDRPLASHNTLFLNQGDGSWIDIAHSAGVAASEWSWSTAFLDVDLDGHEDILVGTGHAFDILDLDAMERIVARRRQARTNTRLALEDLLLFPPLAVPNQAFRNQRNRSFAEVGASWGFHATEVSHGMALADLDNDGDLDIVINCLNSPPLLYRNNATAPRIAVRLAGRPPNTRGIGSRLRLLGGPVEQSQVVIAGGRYLSGDDPVRVFAAGNNPHPSAFTLEVDWPDGQRQVIHPVHPNALVEVRQPDPDNANPNGTRSRPSLEQPPLFTDVSHLLDHQHVDPPFDDFLRQPLLPRKLSQGGPGLAWADLDGDGWEDLVVGSGRGGTPAFLRNLSGSRFESLPHAGTPLEEDLTGIAVLPAHPGTGKPARVLAALADWESDTPRGGSILAFAPPSTNPPVTLHQHPVSPGPIALADMNRDGHLDLFVGGHSRKGRHPEATPSTLLLGRNDGSLHPDAAHAATLGQTGPVNGAVWSDLDDDGWPDLILACDWGPVRVFQNRQGTLVDRTADWGLAPHTGWWNGVATGDFDGDGRMDIVATNWGTNSAFQASPDSPQHLFHTDLDPDGWIDLIEAETDPATGRLVPRRNLVVLGAVFPFLRQAYPTHAAFARTDVQSLLRNRYATAAHLQATTLESSVFLNRDGRFERYPLPDRAQWAPAFGVAVADFNGDGHEDIALAQNFFATAPDRPRLDSGTALLLAGRGDGTFIALPARASGIRALGEQRGLAVADFDRDGRPDIAIGQNAAATLLFRNTLGRPGIRVELEGPPGNPAAVGARIRLFAMDGTASPPREVQAGGGYWSQNSLVHVLHPAAADADVIAVRWPDGSQQQFPVPPGAGSLRIRHPDTHPPP